jgi:Cu/Ag efflux pump CusA
MSMIAANIPLALALEPGSSVRSSLGVVVIGGVSSSLILTLVLVPIMYMILAPKTVRVTHRDTPSPNGNGKVPQLPEAVGAH